MTDDFPLEPDLSWLPAAKRLAQPWRWLANPVFTGMERIPERGPMLFVGNHTIYGFLDVPLLVLEIHERRGIWTRTLGDHAHFKIPGWGPLLTYFGSVDGTRENFSRLMEAGQSILVFPGGARETSKRKGEQYTLIWGERLGFARMAIQHGCPIVPFAAVGVEDAYDVHVDAEDYLRTPILGHVLRGLGVRKDVLYPIATGIGPTPLPRPERLYFEVCEPIDVTAFGDDPGDDEAARAVRSEVASAIEAAIERLREQRARDPRRTRWPELFG